MPGNKKPRKPHAQRAVPHTPMTIRFSEADELILQAVPHSQLENLRQGTADEGAFHDLACRINLGYVLADRHFAAAELDATRQGLDAVVLVRERFERTKKHGVSGGEFKAIGQALNITDEMQKECTRRQLRDALKFVFTHAAI